MEGSRGFRISDADREHAARRLQTAMAEGRITFAELDERLALVYAARYADEVAVPLADLPPDPSSSALPPAVPPGHRAAGEPLVLRATMGDIKRAGAWQVPALLDVQSTMGNLRLDFTTAVLVHPVVEVRIKLSAGTAKFIVPEGATADLDGVVASMGSVKNKVPDRPREGRLHLVVRGRVSMGDVVVRHTYEVGRFRF